MSDKHETVADIVAAMRGESKEPETADTYTAWRLNEYANRIEAAAKPETEPEARVWCLKDPTRKCVDCELCPDDQAEATGQ